MKTKLKQTGLFILALAVLAGSLCYVYRKEIKAHFIPSVEQLGDIHIQIQSDTCYVCSKLIVINKSFFKIGIDTIKYKVSVFNKIYLQSERFMGITLEGHSKDTVDFALKIPYKIIIEDLKAERKKGDSASYSINVSLQYSTLFGKEERPINKSAKLKIPQPPDIEVIDIKYKKVRLRSIHADVKIKIINYSDVDLSIKKMTYTINVLKQGNLKGSHIEEIKIRPRRTSFVELPIEISPKNIVKTLFDVMLNKDSYDYTLKLKASLESSGALKDTFAIDIVKLGKMELKK